MSDTILVSDWEKVEKDDFYLSEDWEKEIEDSLKQAKELQKAGKLYYAYIVEAKSYALYYQMDASKVLIDENADIIVHCESAVIGDHHRFKTEFDY